MDNNLEGLTPPQPVAQPEQPLVAAKPTPQVLHAQEEPDDHVTSEGKSFLSTLVDTLTGIFGKNSPKTEAPAATLETPPAPPLAPTQPATPPETASSQPLTSSQSASTPPSFPSASLLNTTAQTLQTTPPPNQFPQTTASANLSPPSEIKPQN